jgi:hypothetical protein
MSMAMIMKGILGSHWTVQEKIGSTLYFTNHDTLEDAVAYCIENNLSYTII